MITKKKVGRPKRQTRNLILKHYKVYLSDDEISYFEDICVNENRAARYQVEYLIRQAIKEYKNK